MEGTEVVNSLSSVVTTDMISGVFSEIMSLLPVVLPVSITYMGFRKGLGFLLGSLRRA